MNVNTSAAASAIHLPLSSDHTPCVNSFLMVAPVPIPMPSRRSRMCIPTGRRKRRKLIVRFVGFFSKIWCFLSSFLFPLLCYYITWYPGLLGIRAFFPRLCRLSSYTKIYIERQTNRIGISVSRCSSPFLSEFEPVPRTQDICWRSRCCIYVFSRFRLFEHGQINQHFVAILAYHIGRKLPLFRKKISAGLQQIALAKPLEEKFSSLIVVCGNK